MKKFITLIIILTSLSYSQNLTIDNNKDFDRAVGYYKSRNYNDALSLFKKIENRDDNTKASASAFFISKILNEQKRYSEAENFCNEFLSKYSQSKYASEVKNILIKNYVDNSEYEKAFNRAIDLVESSKSIVFIKETKDIADKIAVNYLKSSDVEKILNSKTNSSIKPFLILLTGKLLLREGDRINALKKFSEITSKYISSDEYPEAIILKKSSSIAAESSENLPLVCAMLSVTEPNGRDILVANEVLAGIKFAFHEYNSTHSDKVGLVIKDIQKDKTKIIDAANRMIENSNIRCIIGPLFSDDVRTVLEETDESNICVISPTATDDDLKSLSENFYQANPSLTSRGKIFAQYLYFVENKRNLAILNSIEGYSPLLAASFTEEFEKLGGKIIAKETYRSNSFDLAEQLSRISIVANSIDGIYAPISNANDATAVLSQMVQSGLDIQLYGNQDWFLGKGFESSSSISNKLTFDSDYFINFNDSDFKKFSDSFKSITGMDVNRNILYGYDCAKYVLTIIRNIDPTRKSIKYKMESGVSVTGFHNNISFDSERNNRYLNIVRFNDGVFELVEKFRSSE